MIKKLYNLWLRRADPVKYARRHCAHVGSNVRICGRTDFGSEPWLIEIGDHVLLSGNVNFVNHDGSTWVFREQERYKNVIKYGKIKIGNNCFIGLGTTILPGVTIGDNVVIGAGSVVSKDIPSNCVACGVPAKVVCGVEEYAQSCLKNTPDYDVAAYKRDKKTELLRVLKD